MLRAVAREGSLTAAARSLGYTQPAVSHHIARLEEEVGTALLTRLGPRRAAHRRRPRARRARRRRARRLTAAEEDIAAIAGLRAGRVRLAAFPSASATLMAGALARLRAAHPGIEVMFAEAEPEDALPRLRAGSSTSSRLLLRGVGSGDGRDLEARRCCTTRRSRSCPPATRCRRRRAARPRRRSTARPGSPAASAAAATCCRARDRGLRARDRLRDRRLRDGAGARRRAPRRHAAAGARARRGAPRRVAVRAVAGGPGPHRRGRAAARRAPPARGRRDAAALREAAAGARRRRPGPRRSGSARPASTNSARREARRALDVGRLALGHARAELDADRDHRVRE